MYMFFQNLHVGHASVEIASNGTVIPRHDFSIPFSSIQKTLQEKAGGACDTMVFYFYGSFTCFEYKNRKEGECILKKLQDATHRDRNLLWVRNSLRVSLGCGSCESQKPDVHEWEYVGFDPYSPHGKLYIDKKHSLGALASPVFKTLLDERTRGGKNKKEYACLEDGTKIESKSLIVHSKFMICINTMQSIHPDKENTLQAVQRLMVCLTASGMLVKDVESMKWIDKLPKDIKNAVKLPLDFM